MNDIAPFYLDFTYTKAIEDDYQNDTSDQDLDMYHVHGFYTGEEMMAGLLFGFINNKTNDEGVTVLAEDVDPASPTFGDPISIDLTDEGFSQQYWHFNPYIKGTAGPISYMAELEWKTGDFAEFSSGDDVDYDAKRWIVDAAFDTGPASVGAGWAHSDGQEWDESDYTRADGGGGDWAPLLILTHPTSNSALGGIGNLNSGNNDTLLTEGGDVFDVGSFGFDIYYIYGSFAPTEKLTLGAIIGWAYADTADVTESAEELGLDDEFGWEFDLTAKYQVMDNLTYDVKFGYFSPGDLYDDIGLDDETWSVMHTLMITF
ncbi:MAG: hypothetical protein JRF37_09025 [Deltaproteobacteria bacterium]|nr:hypothetical protein [Deltaproteobacteria bacterium]